MNVHKTFSILREKNRMFLSPEDKVVTCLARRIPTVERKKSDVSVVERKKKGKHL
jgi:hypothetical protein